MMSNLFIYYFSGVLFILLIGLPNSSSEDDRKLRVFTSFGVSNGLFAFEEVDLLCNSQNIFICRDFQCTASSNVTTKISWYFAHAYQRTTVEITKNVTFENNRFRFSSNVTLEDEDVGFLRCVVTNKLGHVNKTTQVTPINQPDRIFLSLPYQTFAYRIDEEAVYMTWYVVVDGHPKPKLKLIIDNNTLDCKNESECNNYCCNISQATTTIVNVTMQNFSNTNLRWSFFLLATNDYENATFTLYFFMGLKDNFRIHVDKVKKNYALLTCSAYYVVPCNISWTYLNSSLDNPFKQYLIGKQAHNSPLLYSTQLKVFPYMKDGVLDCVLESAVGRATLRPSIDSINGEMILYQQGEDLVCKTSVYYYSPQIIWSVGKLNIEINTTDKYFIVGPKQRVFIVYSTLKIPTNVIYAVYFCKAYFHNGTLDYRSIEIPSNKTFGSKSLTVVLKTTTWIYYTISVVLIVLVSVLIFVIIKIVAYRKKLEMLKSIGLANYNKLSLKDLNLNLTIAEQVDLLPYDKTYEFPLEQLKLGEQIGSGAFGVVRKAEAKNILKNEPVTTVAVKMVNKDFGEIKNLASELKIMIHLGKHINIVNLLGVCTKHITKSELFVIVEYCRFGNLREYLLSYKHTFINQINLETDRIDFTIGKEVLGLNYIHISDANSSDSKDLQESCSTSNELQKLISNDKQDGAPVVCTRNLLLWSFQVACGMEYLSSRKIIHGDLAARNILLTDANVVKICDFGLSKNLYQKDIYQKTGDDLLPVKWLAIEAITDKIFSVQSDVWSFGIVMWELFSLARTPYFEMEFNKSFCDKLLEGYRMETPQYANEEIYDIMLDCWKSEPMERPSFSYLVNKLGSLLEPNVTQYYIDMNSGYVKMNSRRFKDKNADYLSSTSAPQYSKVLTSFNTYVNDPISLNK